jgi:hypothetical protein
VDRRAAPTAKDALDVEKADTGVAEQRAKTAEAEARANGILAEHLCGADRSRTLKVSDDVAAQPESSLQLSALTRVVAIGVSASARTMETWSIKVDPF